MVNFIFICIFLLPGSFHTINVFFINLLLCNRGNTCFSLISKHTRWCFSNGNVCHFCCSVESCVLTPQSGKKKSLSGAFWVFRPWLDSVKVLQTLQEERSGPRLKFPIRITGLNLGFLCFPSQPDTHMHTQNKNNILHWENVGKRGKNRVLLLRLK